MSSDVHSLYDKSGTERHEKVQRIRCKSAFLEVTRALEEFIARRKQKRLINLMDKLERDVSFGYKGERSRK